MPPADQRLAERLLAEKLVSPEKLADCQQAQREAEQSGQQRPPLAQELMRRRLLPSWQLGQLLLGLESGFDSTRHGPEGEPDEVTPSPTPPALGRYPVGSLLGAGGIGQVLGVKDPHLGRSLAAKMIRGTASASVKARFIQEAQITGRLEHPNIVPVHELGMTDDGRLYFTMKRVQGEDLKSSLADRPLFELLQILLRVCDALAFAHSQGVIHRDLKPANIMVGRFGEVQVMDWGLAKVVGEPDLSTTNAAPATIEPISSEEGAEPHTSAGTVLGTYAYMAPEQARGDIGRLDRRTDIYALGALLYEILTGCPPYVGGTSQAILVQVVAGQLIPPGKRAPNRQTPPELEAVTLKAMATRPAGRYDSIVLMKQDIEAYLEGRLLQAADYSTWQVGKKWAARHQAAAAATAGILLAVIAAFIGITLQWQRADEEKDRAKLREQEAQIARKEAVAALEERDRATLKKEVAQGKRSAAEKVRKAMELYRRKADTMRVLSLLAEAEQVHPDHSGLLRLRGRIALDQKQPDWAKAKSCLDRALKRDPKDYVTHFLLYRWYAEQELGTSPCAEKHVLAAAAYGTRDSAIGLWGLARREYQGAQKQPGSEKTRAIERSLQFSTQALAKRADFVWALMIRGLCYGQLQRWSEALADFDAVLELLPRSAVAYCNRGPLYKMMTQYEKALADFDTALRIAPGNLRAYRNRGVLYSKMNRYDKALADFDRIIQLNPRNTVAHVNRGEVHLNRKRYDKALADFDKAIRLDPRHTNAYNSRGVLHREMKRYDKALADFDKAIRLDPHHPNAYSNRGILHRHRKRYDKALADFDEAIRLDPHHANAYHGRANLYAPTKRHERAWADYDMAIQNDPRNALVYNNRGHLHLKMKRYDKALADFDEAIRLDPHHAEAYQGRANLYALMKRHERALADYDMAIRLDPRVTEAYSNRGLLHTNLRRYEKALADYDRAIDLEPHTALPYINRGSLHARMKRYDKALADFDKAISIDPRVANAYYGIACLYSLMKKLDQAFKHLNKAIDCGFRNWGWMRKDEDLKNLHQDPRWKKALARQQEEKKESR